MTPKPKVYISCFMVGDAVKRLEKDFEVVYRNDTAPASDEEVKAGAKDAEVLVCLLDDNIDAKLIESAKNLKMISQVAVGFDNIAVEAATERNILVTNTPGVLTNATADLAFALMLAVSRRIVEADQYVRAGRWTAWTADLMLGHELAGKTMGVVGLGRIGEAFARRAAAFGMRIVYTRRGTAETEDAVLKAHGAKKVELDQLLRESDYISLHCPATTESKNMIGAPQFEKMKRSCFLINTARGAVVDQPALVEALKSGKIAGAGLDVFVGEPHVPDELKTMDNVVLAPHMGSATVETRSAMANLVVDGILLAYAGKLPPNSVNPDVWSKSSLNAAKASR